MKRILFGFFLAIAAVACDTPENSSGNDMSTPPSTADTMMSNPSTMDTVMTTPVDTTGSMPSQPMDTTTNK